MANIFSKDEDLYKSAPIVGYEILKMLTNSEQKKISIFDIANKLDSTRKTNVRSIYYGMMFLYSIDLIDFNAPYLVIK